MIVVVLFGMWAVGMLVVWVVCCVAKERGK